jgi:hypothetical protein
MGPTRLTNNDTAPGLLCQGKTWQRFARQGTLPPQFVLTSKKQNTSFIAAMRFTRILLIALLITGAANVACGGITLRLKAGWSLPAGEFKEKSTVTDNLGTVQIVDNISGYALAAELVTRVPGFPLDLVLTAGRCQFEDRQWGDMELTSYEHPEGTGEFTDYHHRINSIGFKAELPVALAPRAVTTLGVGPGWYSYSYVNHGTEDPTLLAPAEHTNLGWQFGLTQSIRIVNRVGICLSFEYHTVNLSDDDDLGFGTHINRITFYTIQLGVTFRFLK